MTENQKLKIKGCKSKADSQSGFSLMELMIVIVVMMIIISATFSLMQGTMTTANTNFEMTGAAQSLRNSQEFLTRDILTAGDGLKGISNVWLPTPFVTNYLSSRPASELDPLNRQYVSIGSIVSDDNVPAGVNVKDSNPATSVLPDSDRLTLLAVDPSYLTIDIPAGAANPATGIINIPATRIAKFHVGEIYYLTSGATGVFGTVTEIDAGANTITWGTNDDFGLNQLGEGGTLSVGTRNGTSPAALRRVNIIHYFADAEGRLVRRAFGVQEAGFIDSVVAEHIQTLQFRFILRPPTTTTGTIFEQPLDSIELADAQRVRIIEQSVQVRTANPLSSGEFETVDGLTQIGVRNVQFLEAPVPLDSQGNTTLPDPDPPPYVPPTPTPTPLPTPIPSPTPTPVATPTPEPTPTPEATPEPTPEPTREPTPEETPPRTPDPTPTPTPRLPTPTPTPRPGNGDG